jgi:hypothetical protein
MKTVQFESKVGVDGVLSLQIPFGTAEAQQRVLITVQPLPAEPPHEAQGVDWPTFVAETYGSCAGLGLEEPEDLSAQQRPWPPQ